MKTVNTLLRWRRASYRSSKFKGRKQNHPIRELAAVVMRSASQSTLWWTFECRAPFHSAEAADPASCVIKDRFEKSWSLMLPTRTQLNFSLDRTKGGLSPTLTRTNARPLNQPLKPVWGMFLTLGSPPPPPPIWNNTGTGPGLNPVLVIANTAATSI